MAWFESVDNDLFFLNVLTLGEIRKGIEKLDDLGKKQKLIQWVDGDLVRNFSHRIIEIDSLVADKWGFISAYAPVPAIDGLIGASALVHNLTLVTRNTRDFSSIPGINLFNPCI